MPNIETYLAKIREAVYGEEVRGSIHDAIQAINDEVVNSDQVHLRNSIASQYNASTAYEVGEYVFYPADGILYRCIKAGSGQTPSVGSQYWTVVELSDVVSDLSSSISSYKPLQIDRIVAYNFKEGVTNDNVTPCIDELNSEIISSTTGSGSSAHPYGIAGRNIGEFPIFEVNDSIAPGTSIDTGICCVLEINTDYTDGFLVNIGFSTGSSWGLNETSVEYESQNNPIYIKKSGIYVFGPKAVIFRKASLKTEMKWVYINFTDSIPSGLITSIKNGNTTFKLSYFNNEVLKKLLTSPLEGLDQSFIDGVPLDEGFTYNYSVSKFRTKLSLRTKSVAFSTLKKGNPDPMYPQQALGAISCHPFLITTQSYNINDTGSFDFFALITVNADTFGHLLLLKTTSSAWGGEAHFDKELFLSKGSHIVPLDNMIVRNSAINSGTKFDKIVFENHAQVHKINDVSISLIKGRYLATKLQELTDLSKYSGQLAVDTSDSFVYNDSEYADVLVSSDYRFRRVTRYSGTGVTDLGVRFGRISSDYLVSKVVIKVNNSTGNVPVRGIYLSTNSTSWSNPRVGIENIVIPKGTSYYTIDNILSVQNMAQFGGYLWIHLGADCETEESFEIGYILNPPEISDKTFSTMGAHFDLSSYTWNAVGDSITDAGYYLTKVHAINNINVVNCGLSSSTIAINNTYLHNQSIVERVLGLNGNTPYADADIWTIMGGLNDVLYRSTLGSLVSTGNVFNNATVYGALQSMCEHIMNLRAHPRLILLTPTQTVRDDWSKQTYGITIAEIRQAIIDVGEYYSVPVLDMWAVAGINHYNMRKNTNPTTSDGVHPTDAGASIMSIPVADALESMF